MRNFTDRELATVLHALRTLQCEGRLQGCAAGDCEHFEEAEALTNDEIDAFCEEINVVQEEPPKPLKLTHPDWTEIYYALEFKRDYSAAVAGDARWIGHLNRILKTIGFDGDDAAKVGVSTAARFHGKRPWWRRMKDTEKVQEVRRA